MATVDIGGPFKVETTPHTIAAKVTVPEQRTEDGGQRTEDGRPTVWIAVAVAVVIVILAVGLAARGKKQQPE